MPGISNRGPVSAHDGFGKVYFKFREVRRKHWIVYFLGFVLYVSFFFAMFFTYGWNRDWLKNGLLVPITRRLFAVAEISLQTQMGMTTVKSVGVDQNGIVFMSGRTLSEVLFNQGYIHAKNKFIQMDLYRRTSQGRLSELLGSNTIDVDKLSLKLNFMNLAIKDVSALEQSDADLLSSYAEGVNKYISEELSSWSTTPLDLSMLYGNWTNMRPVAVAPWQPVDTLSVMRLLAYEWSSGWERSLLKDVLLSAGPAAELSDVDWLVPSAGANAFVVSGKHTRSGAPIMASDVHSKASFSGFWFLNGIETPEMKVVGASVPGIPLVFMGRNDHISWSFAAPVSGREHLVTVSEETSVAERQEVLLVRGDKGADDSFVSVSVREALVSVDGKEVRMPLLSDLLPQNVHSYTERTAKTTVSVAVNSAALTNPISLKFLLGLSVAQNWSDFTSACAAEKAMVVSVLFSDVGGDIGLSQTGTTSHSVLNPETGYIVLSAASATYHDRNRLVELIRTAIASGNLSSASAASILVDTFSPSAAKLVKLAISVAGNDNLSKDAVRMVKAGQELVRDFDGRYDAGSASPVLLEAFRAALVHSVARKNEAALINVLLGGSRLSALKRHQSADSASGEWVLDLLLLPDQSVHPYAELLRVIGDRNELVRSSLLAAYAWCEEQFGRNQHNWRWGAAHSVSYQHPSAPHFYLSDAVFSRGPSPIGGGVDTLLYTPHNINGDVLYHAHALHNTQESAVSSLRLVVDLADESHINAAAIMGQSCSIGSKHFLHDPISKWASGELHRVCWSAACKRREVSGFCSVDNAAAQFSRSECAEQKRNEL